MIVFFHLLNDASGSPRVLKASIAALSTADRLGMLYVGSDGEGVLSDIGIPIRKYWYRRTRWRILTLVTFLLSQLVLLVRLLRDRTIDRRAIVYVNTLLPFGAAIYGWLTGRTVVYHVHEVSVKPAPLRWLLVGVVRLTSSLNLYVSDAHQASLPISGVPSCRIHNSLDSHFVERATSCSYQWRRGGMFTILMIASLRNYKGIPELLGLAERMANRDDVGFDLLVNDSTQAIQHYFISRHVPRNLKIHPRVADTAPFYERASLLLNLSRVDQCIETFGLTLLEAMAYGIPVIAPPVGGPVELITDGDTGFLVDSRDTSLLERKILALVQDEALCRRLSTAGRARAANFSEESFSVAIRDALHGVRLS